MNFTALLIFLFNFTMAQLSYSNENSIVELVNSTWGSKENKMWSTDYIPTAKDRELLHFLIKFYEDKNLDINSPLFFHDKTTLPIIAVRFGKKEDFERLLCLKTTIDFNYQDLNGKCLLNMAVVFNPDLLPFLLKLEGINPNIQSKANRGHDLGMIAVKYQKEEVIFYHLIPAGYLPFNKDSLGLDLLIYSLVFDKYDLFMQLSKQFAYDFNSKIKAPLGLTYIHYMIASKLPDKILIDFFKLHKINLYFNSPINVYENTLATTYILDDKYNKSSNFPKIILRKLIKKYGKNMSLFDWMEVYQRKDLILFVKNTFECCLVNDSVYYPVRKIGKKYHCVNGSNLNCSICLNPVEAKLCFSNPCNTHKEDNFICCSDCQMDLLRLHQLNCPIQGCRQLLVPSFFLANPAISNEKILQEAKRYYLSKTRIMNHVDFCKTPGCELGYKVLDPNTAEFQWLDPCLFCKKASALRTRGINFEKFDEINEKNSVKACPKCNVNIYKDQGCQHINCPVCYHQWHWKTKARFFNQCPNANCNQKYSYVDFVPLKDGMPNFDSEEELHEVQCKICLTKFNWD